MLLIRLLVLLMCPLKLNHSPTESNNTTVQLSGAYIRACDVCVCVCGVLGYMDIHACGLSPPTSLPLGCSYKTDATFLSTYIPLIWI